MKKKNTQASQVTSQTTQTKAKKTGSHTAIAIAAHNAAAQNTSTEENVALIGVGALSGAALGAVLPSVSIATGALTGGLITGAALLLKALDDD